jgi:hypothetical protein
MPEANVGKNEIFAGDSFTETFQERPLSLQGSGTRLDENHGRLERLEFDRATNEWWMSTNITDRVP